MDIDNGTGPARAQQGTPDSLRGVAVHPYAATFPMLSDDELDELAADIQMNGLREAVVYAADGQLLDGRNRLEACRRAGVAPRRDVLPDGVDPIAYILSKNVERRHLSASQRAMAVARAGRFASDHLTRTEQAKTLKVNRDYLAKADTLLAEAPALADAVTRGRLSVQAAYDQMQRQHAKQPRIRSRPTANARNLRGRAGVSEDDLRAYDETIAMALRFIAAGSAVRTPEEQAGYLDTVVDVTRHAITSRDLRWAAHVLHAWAILREREETADAEAQQRRELERAMQCDIYRQAGIAGGEATLGEMPDAAKKSTVATVITHYADGAESVREATAAEATADSARRQQIAATHLADLREYREKTHLPGLSDLETVQAVWEMLHTPTVTTNPASDATVIVTRPDDELVVWLHPDSHAGKLTE